MIPGIVSSQVVDSGSWTPADLGGALLTWLDASDLTTLDLGGSDEVLGWTDKSPLALGEWQGSGGAVWVSDVGLNSMPGMHFTGGLGLDNENGPSSVSSSPWAMHMLVIESGSTNEGFYEGGDVLSGGLGVFGDKAGQWQVASDVFTMTNSFSLSGYVLSIVSDASGSVDVYVDGSLVAFGSFYLEYMIGYLGYVPGTGQVFTGAIAEVVAHDYDTDDYDDALLYLMTRYGLV